MTGLSWWLRWFPFAWGGKNARSTVEQLRAVQQVGEAVTPPTRTHPADKQKLRMYPRMRVMRKRA